MIKTKIKKILVALDGSKNSQRGLDLGIDDIIQYYIGKEGILAIKRIKESNISKLAKSLSGKQQLAVEKFADSMESIPLALARNAGMNPIDSITQLRAKYRNEDHITGFDLPLIFTISESEAISLILSVFIRLLANKIL